MLLYVVVVWDVSLQTSSPYREIFVSFHDEYSLVGNNVTLRKSMPKSRASHEYKDLEHCFKAKINLLKIFRMF